LEVETKELVYIIAGPEFGELAEGHTLLVFCLQGPLWFAVKRIALA
jgi:hypothetical protein